MRVISVRDEQEQWDAFVRGSQAATAYHCYGWRQVIRTSFGHPSHYLAAVADTGEWRGILPLVHMRSRIFGNFLVSLPFVNYGGLVCKEVAAAALLLAEAEKLRQSCGAKYVELRHLAPPIEALPAKQHKVTMILPLSHSDDEQWKRFDPKLRNQIRKAQKSGLEVLTGRAELLDRFYQVFARNMRDLGTPVYTKRFFQAILETFPDASLVFLVSHAGKTVAAGMASWFRDRFEVPWASSVRDYKALCPNHMLYWEAIRFAMARGFKEFDFGRSTPNEGTFNFKKQWGAAPVQLNWQYLLGASRLVPELNPSNPRYRLAIGAWKRLPVWATKAIGPSIVRNIP
jgi:FemAB-related protein (PEP-CTERM system-associated)